mgnify:FL=1
MQHVIAGAAAALILAGALHLAGVLPGPAPEGAADRYGFSIDDPSRGAEHAGGSREDRPGGRAVR